jgi:hypothetical protein
VNCDTDGFIGNFKDIYIVFLIASELVYVTGDLVLNIFLSLVSFPNSFAGNVSDQTFGLVPEPSIGVNFLFQFACWSGCKGCGKQSSFF